MEIEKCDLSEIKSELMETKKLLDNKFGKLNEEKIIESKKELERYIALGLVSGFYAILCPTIKKYCNLQNIDLSYYDNNVNDDARKLYTQIFEGE